MNPPGGLLPEQRARIKIDEALAASGWIVQDRDRMNQAEGEFMDFVTPDDHRKLPELYKIQRLTSIYSLWSQVLEYFDAYLVGLTATPANHTYAFFKSNVVMEYSHERAVADGVNVQFFKA